MVKSSGVAPGERRLNGPQTSGREYADLSLPEHEIRTEQDARVPMRDGVELLADVLRPATAGRFPALIAFSPYPRQMQNSGVPMGFVEAGASDFFVPRGYAHVLVNARGTSGSGGTFTFLDAQERQDLYDVIEWAAAQPWCDGNVGMVGISYFAMAQVAAASERPPHLRAIFPFAVTTEPYRGVFCPGGMPSAGFITAWMSALGTFSGKGPGFFRGPLAHAAQALLRTPWVHARFEHFDGEAAANVLGKLIPASYDPHPWDDLIRAFSFEHPLIDAFWEDRTYTARLRDVKIPVYLGCDWDNVPVHLPCTFFAWDALAANGHKRMTILPRGGLGWPWESLHVEALAWFDRWLKGRATGIDRGDAVSYWLEGAGEWRRASAWPPPGASLRALHLRADGALAPEQGPAGSREYRYVSPLQPANRNRAPAASLPASLAWETAPLAAPLDVVGPIELALTARTTATDVDWIVRLCDVAPDGRETTLTQGWLRGSHRALDPARSAPGAPWHTHDRSEPVTPGEPTAYRIAVVPTAQRFAAGHRVRVVLASSDLDGSGMQRFEHVPLAASGRHEVLSSSQLLLPVLAG
jgi:putative CocE/NonD family hydrolase